MNWSRKPKKYIYLIRKINEIDNDNAASKIVGTEIWQSANSLVSLLCLLWRSAGVYRITGPPLKEPSRLKKNIRPKKKLW